MKNKNLTITIILVIGILILVNFFSYHIFHRWDLTENKTYSISDTSKEVVRNLEDIVQVKLYFSKDLPHEYESIRQSVLDILNEYSSYSSNFRVEIIDEVNEVDAYRLEIPQLQFNVLKKDQFQVVNGYMGLSVEYYDRQEVIPIVQASNLEYELTGILKKITSDGLPTIGFLISHGAYTPNEKLTIVKEDLQKNYIINDINLPTVETIDEDIKTLIMINPSGSFSEDQMRMLDDFLMRGNSLFIAQDKQLVSALQTQENKSNLNNFLDKYGLKINNELVLDRSNALASFSQGPVNFSINYPFWLMIMNKNFDQYNPAVSNLDSLILPWASSVTYKQKSKNSNVMYLAKTTDKAWNIERDFNLNPAKILVKANTHQFDLVIGLTGIQSAYQDKFNQDARIVVMGDSEFIVDDFLKSHLQNKTFFLNIIDYLSVDEDLISIRSKETVDRPIKELPDYQKQIIKYGNVFGITIIVIIFGLSRYFLRKRSNNVKL
ncbi:MAG: GldG family protein [bacterium]